MNLYMLPIIDRIAESTPKSSAWYAVEMNSRSGVNHVRISGLFLFAIVQVVSPFLIWMLCWAVDARGPSPFKRT